MTRSIKRSLPTTNESDSKSKIRVRYLSDKHLGEFETELHLYAGPEAEQVVTQDAFKNLTWLAQMNITPPQIDQSVNLRLTQGPENEKIHFDGLFQVVSAGHILGPSSSLSIAAVVMNSKDLPASWKIISSEIANINGSQKRPKSKRGRTDVTRASGWSKLLPSLRSKPRVEYVADDEVDGAYMDNLSQVSLCDLSDLSDVSDLHDGE